jgi:hypothetical protein
MVCKMLTGAMRVARSDAAHIVISNSECNESSPCVHTCLSSSLNETLRLGRKDSHPEAKLRKTQIYLKAIGIS